MKNKSDNNSADIPLPHSINPSETVIALTFTGNFSTPFAKPLAKAIKKVFGFEVCLMKRKK